MINPNLNDTARRVLILAPFGRDADLLTRILNKADIPAEPCADVQTLCQAIGVGVGSVLVSDEAFTVEGLELLQACVSGQETWSDLPIFVMTRGQAQGRIHLKRLEPLGNITILERPVRSDTLVSAFRMGLRARDHQYQLRARFNLDREAADALRESELRYRTLADAMPQLVWTCNGGGACDYVNQQWLVYTGAPHHEQFGFGWLNRIHADDRLRASDAWSASHQTGVQYEVEYRMLRHDGEYRWFKARAIPTKNDAGEVTRWHGSCIDIEDEKRVSEERRMLLMREQKARALAELLNRVGPTLLRELDSHRLAQKVTDLATELTGADFGALFHAEEEGGPAPQTFAVSGVSSSAFAEFKIQPFFPDQGITSSHDVANDPRFPQPFCQAPVKSYLAARLISRSGNIMGALVFAASEPGVFRDLQVKIAEGIAAQAAIALDNARLFSEAQQAEEVLRRSNIELRRANEDLNQFAYSASHDLQEPLRMVALYSQMLHRKYLHLLDGTAAEYLGFMVQGARRMELLLKDLLDYTQVVSVQDERSEQTDSEQVLQGVVQNLNQAIKDSQATVESTGLPVVPVKQVHVLQLFQNLVGNALKYRGTESPQILISALDEGGTWKFSVTDNGIGIASQYTQQVFGLFKRLHGNSRYEGTGIGLAICQKIVERYGGRIWVESEGEGKGCTFWFTLPGVAATA